MRLGKRQNAVQDQWWGIDAAKEETLKVALTALKFLLDMKDQKVPLLADAPEMG